MVILPDKYNPCKLESGKIGESIYNFINYIYSYIVKILTPSIQCSCCRKVNYWFMKYGIVILLVSMFKYSVILGLSMVFMALLFRITETINLKQLRKKES